MGLKFPFSPPCLSYEFPAMFPLLLNTRDKDAHSWSMLLSSISEPVQDKQGGAGGQLTIRTVSVTPAVTWTSHHIFETGYF